MKKIMITTAVLAAITLTGCSSSSGGDGSTTAPPSVETTTELGVGVLTDDPGPAETPTATPTKAGVGATVSVKNDDSTEDVTLVAIKKTATAADGSKPASGNRYFAAQFKLTNTGTQALQDGPYISAKVMDADGQTYEVATVEKITAGAPLPGTVDAEPGESQTGWLAFEVPANAKVTKVEYQVGALGDTAKFTI